ncbi:hypothetical protein GB931_21185 [Modestobacter sp. I12A-02628]|uniref:PH domain-containing protein n=1 Tax=Goekera deserti TaxID=2497753 RepID=A0A7K3WFR1_9ACTN|nr:hypothetical protein [Goekera deserti]MPR00388.1 hypothetical protein [Goekera deserti]NDI50409.1 hypothetical protein [Goekera deserti]NEL55325.1 hypothetical protein [Goekera deserti]
MDDARTTETTSRRDVVLGRSTGTTGTRALFAVVAVLCTGRLGVAVAEGDPGRDVAFLAVIAASWFLALAGTCRPTVVARGDVLRVSRQVVGSVRLARADVTGVELLPRRWFRDPGLVVLCTGRVVRAPGTARSLEEAAAQRRQLTAWLHA